MRTQVWLGLVAAGGVAAIVGGSLASFVTTNGLFLDSAWATAAAVTLALVVAIQVALVVLSGPDENWLGSPYW
jgi:hypothetical protein